MYCDSARIDGSNTCRSNHHDPLARRLHNLTQERRLARSRLSGQKNTLSGILHKIPRGLQLLIVLHTSSYSPAPDPRDKHGTFMVAKLRISGTRNIKKKKKHKKKKLIFTSEVYNYSFRDNGNLDQFVSFAEVLDTELRGGCATVVILYYRIADIYRVASLDMVKVICHIECDR